MDHFDRGDGYFPTREAARYLGFRSFSGVRKAVMEGRLRPVGRRGGTGPHLFTGPSSIDLRAAIRPVRFMRIVRVRLRTERHMDKKKQWIRRWNCWVAPTRLPGVWTRKRRLPGESPRHGPDVGAEEGNQEVVAGSGRGDGIPVAQRRAGAHPRRPRLGPASADALQRLRSLALGAEGHAKDIKSARSRERWRHTLEHLIGGTEGVQGFGEMFVDQIPPAHIRPLAVGIARFIASGRYSPTTPNGWLSIIRVILKAAKKKFSRPADPMEGIEYFDTSEHETYTAEEPNTLDPEKVRSFSPACARCTRSTTP